MVERLARAKIGKRAKENTSSVKACHLITMMLMMMARPMMRGWYASIYSNLLFNSSPAKQTFFILSSFSNHPKASFYLGSKNKSLIMSQTASAAAAAAAAAVGGGGDHEIPRFERPRYVVKRVLAESQKEGEGAIVRRSIGRPELRNLDPFLMLDEFSVSPPAGFPDHPHRGFETVTYMLEGTFTHQDFAGHKGTISTGDLQWMTAGRGIMHSEMPAGHGVQKGLQLWINLSSKDKMVEPRYQELLSKDISKAEKDGVEVRIIAGEAFGVQSPVYTRTPTMFLDFTMKPGAQLQQPIPDSWNCFVYVIEGEGIFGGEDSTPVTSHHCLVLSPGDGIRVWNKSAKQLRFVLIAGQPLGEPVVQYGPFVMNTQAEIRQAMEDYHYGRNGFEKAKQWKSEPLLH